MSSIEHAEKTGDAMGTDFSIISHDYDKMAARPNQKVTDFLDSLKLDEISSVLDYGCGTGTISKHFVERGMAVDAVDLSEEMLEVSKAKCPALNTMQCQENGQCDTYKDKYDLVISSMVLHHSHQGDQLLQMLSGKASKAYILVEFIGCIESFSKILVGSGWKLDKQDEYLWTVTEEEKQVMLKARKQHSHEGHGHDHDHHHHHHHGKDGGEDTGTMDNPIHMVMQLYVKA